MTLYDSFFIFRELAFQIGDQFKAMGKPINLQTSIITGGMDMMAQSLALAKQPHVVIATPGRCADHLQSTDTFNLLRIKYLVLDEADRLLEDNFAPDLEVIFENIAVKRQTLLFSATLNDTIVELRKITSTDPFCYSIDNKYDSLYIGMESSIIEPVVFIYMFCRIKESFLQLTLLI